MSRILENIKIALKSVGSNRLRTFLTMLGIIIGVGAVVVVMGIGAGTEASIIENIQSVGANVITISPGSSAGGQQGMRQRFAQETEEDVVEGELYLEDAYALQAEASLLEEVAPTYSSMNSTISYLSWSGTTGIVGTTEEYLAVTGYEINQGTFFTEGDVENMSNVVVLGDTVVEDYFGKMNPIGETIKIEGKSFIVVGTVKSVGTSMMGADPDNAVYIPITTAQHRIYGADTINSVSAKVVSEDLVDDAVEEAEEILRIQHSILPGESNDFSVNTNTQILEMASEISSILTVTLGGIAAISLIVGGIGIMNIMFVSVTERTKEIGIRKAVGAKNRDIMIQFLTEGTVLSLLGGIIGLGLAYFLTWVLRDMMTSIITITPIILAISVSTAIGLIFGIFPAMRAARLNPIDALRYE